MWLHNQCTLLVNAVNGLDISHTYLLIIINTLTKSDHISQLVDEEKQYNNTFYGCFPSSTTRALTNTHTHAYTNYSLKNGI